jgi:hypothetical protein
MTRLAISIALTLVVIADGCAFDTSPQLAPGSARETPRAPVPNPPSLDDAQRDPGQAPGTPGPGAMAEPVAPGAGDPMPSDPPMLGEPPTDPSLTDPPPALPESPDAGMAMDPPASDEDSSLIDDLRAWIANSPRVKEADALRRIMAAINDPSGTPDVKDAVNALGDVDCRRNAQTCIAVCSWAVLNCRYCAGDAACVADMTQNCNRGCP